MDSFLPLFSISLSLAWSLSISRKMTMRSISFPYSNLDAKLKPLLEFLLDFGISKSNVLTILIKFPQVVGFSLKENIIPTMLFLQNFGVKKSLSGKTICRSPSILGLREQKMRKNIDFLLGVGVLPNDIGKILTRFPTIVSLSVEHKLLPAVQYFCFLGVDEKNIGRMLTRFPFIIGFSVEDKLPSKVEYFRSFGIDVGYLILHNPQAFALGIESNLVHVTAFFSGKGYTKEEIGIMISKHGSLCCYSLTENVIPKWEFYLTMGYSREELVRLPQYFSYSLEGRIKPRYTLLKESGAHMGLARMLTLTEDSFVKAVKKKVEDSISGRDSRGVRNSSRLSWMMRVFSAYTDQRWTNQGMHLLRSLKSENSCYHSLTTTLTRFLKEIKSRYFSESLPSGKKTNASLFQGDETSGTLLLNSYQ